MDSAYSVTSCCARSASRRIRTEKIIKSWTLPLLVKKTRDMLADKLGSSTSTCDGIITQALSNVQTNIQKLNDQTELASAKVTEFSKLLTEAVVKRENELLAELDDMRSKKMLALEEQQNRLQECVLQEKSAANIVKSFTDDVDLLRIWTWVDESLNKAMRTAEEDKVPCVSSGLVFASTDITQLLNDIGKSGTVLDVADHAVLDCPEDVTTHDDVTLTVEVMSSPTADAVTESATSISSAVRRITIPVCSVSRDQLDSVGLEISVRNLDDDGEFHPVRTRFESLPGCVEMGFDRLQAGTYSVSATIGCRHLQGSPQQLMVTSTETDSSTLKQHVKIVLAQATTILNNLTPRNFKALAAEIYELPINSEELVNGLVEIIYNKAICEPTYCKLYARICKRVQTLQVPADAGNTVTLRKVMLSKCQKDFEERKDVVLEDLKKKHLGDEKKLTSEELKQRTADYEHEVSEVKKRWLGNIQLIGELFKLQIVNQPIVHECLVKLLQSAEDKVSLELMCKLFECTGHLLDHERARSRIDNYFHDIEKIMKRAGNKAVSARIRLMLQDLVDERKHGWNSARRARSPEL
eukprot:scpid44175/ scgid3802/ Eukaryotic translation initiation factor 4 gamma 3; eIF-4-gamma II